MTNDQQFAASFAEIHPPLGRREALVEANRCLYCFDAPCTNACPTHIDVPGFIKKIASGNPGGSAMTILSANILGLSCARVCPVDVLCEAACVMHRYNQRPIEIGRLQRHAMDHFYDAGRRLPAVAASKSERVACIGAGPASLACAAALRQQGFAVTVFDSRPQAGGLNTYGVAEYKLRPSDSQQEVELVRSLGVEFRLSVEIGGELRIKDLEEQFDAVFLGAAMQIPSLLQIEAECSAGALAQRIGPISDDTIGYALQRQSPEPVFALGCESARRLKRNGVLHSDWSRGWLVAAVDGIEICSSFARCCDACMQREVQHKVHGVLRTDIQYYHKIVAGVIVNTPFPVPP